MLTVRLKSSEVGVVRHVLCDRRSEVVSQAAAQAGPERRRIVEPGVDREVEDRHDELFLIAKLLDDLRRHVPVDQPRELVAPTWLLDPVIRAAAVEAAARLQEAVDVFRADTGGLTADELRAALESASASTSTLIGLDYVQNHAVV
jgi:hypothetical protein